MKAYITSGLLICYIYTKRPNLFTDNSQVAGWYRLGNDRLAQIPAQGTAIPGSDYSTRELSTTLFVNGLISSDTPQIGFQLVGSSSTSTPTTRFVEIPGQPGYWAVTATIPNSIRSTGGNVYVKVRACSTAANCPWSATKTITLTVP